MSTVEERFRWLSEAAQTYGGPVPSTSDLALWARFDVRKKFVAEYILWEDREAVLSGFEYLVPALDGPRVSPAPVSAPEPEPEVVANAELRFNQLLRWRLEHPDEAVQVISDSDLARVASSPAEQVEEIIEVSTRLAAASTVASYAQEISFLFTGEDYSDDAEEPQEESTAIVQPEPPVAAAAPPQMPSPATPAASVMQPPVPVDPFAPFEWERIPPFAPFDWASGTAQPIGKLSITHEGDELRLAWTTAPNPAGVTLYRLVESSTSWPSGAPELGGLIGVTRRTSGSLTKQPVGAVTYLAVWANQGANELEAAQAQPILVAVGQIVWPPTDLSLQVTAKKTVAALLTAPENSRVEVQRFLKGMAISYDTKREIDRNAVSNVGFHDENPPLGEDIVYAVFSVTELSDGTASISAPATIETHIIPDVEQVVINVRPGSTPGCYDITWQPPKHGRVYIYATPHKPESGLDEEPRTLEIIESQGLTAQHRVTFPAQDLGEIRLIPNYAVDPSWVRVYFVAVHYVSDDSLWVGPSVTMVTPKTPQFARLVERVDSQIITFSWPKGVSIVEAYQGPRGQQIDPSHSQPIASLTEKGYEQMGGIHLPRALPANGCSVQLHGVVYLDGKPLFSEASYLDYPGITRLSYRIVPVGHDGAPVGLGIRPALYRIYAKVDEDLHQTPLCLVAQLDRLPLHPQDGRLMAQPVVSLQAGIETHVCDVAVGSRPALMRLFVDYPPAQCGSIAVLDPDYDSMDVML